MITPSSVASPDKSYNPDPNCDRHIDGINLEKFTHRCAEDGSHKRWLTYSHKPKNPPATATATPLKIMSAVRDTETADRLRRRQSVAPVARELYDSGFALNHCFSYVPANSKLTPSGTRRRPVSIASSIDCLAASTAESSLMPAIRSKRT